MLRRMATAARKFIDIAANLTDPMYQGTYHGSKKHEADLELVLQRAWSNGLDKMIVLGGSLEDSKAALEVARMDSRLFCTVGCHPTRCGEFEESGDPQAYLAALIRLAQENSDKVIAVGEFGLDYDRLHFCPKDVQKKYFQLQLKLSEATGLPLLLHCRAAWPDVCSILSDWGAVKGVVHSFDGTAEESSQAISMGLHIGLNGCSLKSKGNLDVVKALPAEKIVLETDCPWCEVRPTHAGAAHVKTKFPAVKKEKWERGGMVKGRTEPAHIQQVLEVVAGARNEDPDTLCKVIYDNTNGLFFS